ncbi:helix-turn-helix domain-containing protein [Devosia chinhatensis]|uniref:helix-turn-helix domain-containing protein n=1 Tax=Devosia chinhatensis TaxID=429727 RepID=UPI000695EA20|nr:XRE family transcriptional regulator [Devosia chinhatensis]
MRAPIGFRISNRRKSLKISQAALARLVGISPSYLNLIENNKRDVGGALLQRVAQHLQIEIGDLTGQAEQKLLQDLEEAYADPMIESLPFQPDERRQLVAQYPASAMALAQLHRAYADARDSADAYADRLRSDPLLSQLLHQILSGITAVRSSAEILEDIADLDEVERRRFLMAISREARVLGDVARSLIGQFEVTSQAARTVSTLREIDDLIIERENHFPELEAIADVLRAEVKARETGFGPAELSAHLERGYGVATRIGGRPDLPDFPGQYRYDPHTRVMWFQGTTTLATRQFQLARLLGELAAGDVLRRMLDTAVLTNETSRRLAARALGSYLAGALVFPYSRFLGEAEAAAYDIDHLRESFSGSFEQIAHRLVSLRRPGEEGIPFGFLRSDPAGRLTKHFPLPGLLLPNSGHACPLWAIYGAVRQPDTITRQVVRFSDGSRYLFLARSLQHRPSSFRDQPLPISIMLACDVLHADRTIYAAGLDLADQSADVPVGPSCRLCPRRDCSARQEEMLAPGGPRSVTRLPLNPNQFGLGESG